MEVYKTYEATFIKKNGCERLMTFVRFEDNPSLFLRNMKGTGAHKNLPGGMEVVWDVCKSDFRTFNWETIVGQPEIFCRE